MLVTSLSPAGRANYVGLFLDLIDAGPSAPVHETFVRN